ncbi:MAG: hypothetical protein UHK44_07750 [Bacteroidaceae bacterium]|nr:hypothetical protein [Bacteroidaceae bacterium]
MNVKYNPFTGEFEEDSGIAIRHIVNNTEQQEIIKAAPDTRYVLKYPVRALQLYLSRFQSDRPVTYEFDFITDKGNATVKVQTGVVWVKQPVFYPNKRYMITIDAYNVDTEIRMVGMYLEMEV